MSGDNLHGEQPDIRYNVKVHHQEEWEAMSLTEKMEILSSSIENWESDYLKDNKNKLSPDIIQLLERLETIISAINSPILFKIILPKDFPASPCISSNIYMFNLKA